MKIRPLHDRIVIKRKNEEERTAGGLFIPETAKERPTQATVIAVGKGRYRDDGSVAALAVKVGDTVLFGKYAGTEIKLDGEEVLIIREEDVLAVIDS